MFWIQRTETFNVRVDVYCYCALVFEHNFELLHQKSFAICVFGLQVSGAAVSQLCSKLQLTMELQLAMYCALPYVVLCWFLSREYICSVKYLQV